MMTFKKMTMLCFSLAFTVGIGLVLGSVATAGPLKVDFRAPNPPGGVDATPQDGWDAFIKDISNHVDFTSVQTETYNSSLGIGGTVDVTLNPDTQNNHVAGVFPQWRNRPSVTGGPGADIGNMLGSRWGISSIPAGSAIIPMQISNLKNGTYDLTVYHHDTNAANEPHWDDPANSLTANGIVAAGGKQSTGTQEPDPVGMSTVQFDVTNNVAEIVFTKGQASGELVVNGFQLIPEPGTLVLLCLGGMLLACRRSRR